MKSAAFLIALLAAVVCLSRPASAQETKAPAPPAFKMATINSRDILARCDRGAAVISEIQNKFASQRARLDVLQQEVVKLQEAAKGAPAKGPKTVQIQEKLQTYAVEENKLVQEVAQEESVRFKPVLELVNKVLDEYARENGITAIQERGNFVYIHRSLDITEEIIKRVNLAK